MKKMRFAVWFTALLAVFTFSSCLDSDNGGQVRRNAIVKVSGVMGMYTFQSADGYELVPSNMSQLTMNIDAQYAIIDYSYDSGQISGQTKRIPIELYNVLPIEESYPESSLLGMKEYANAPICAIVSQNSTNPDSMIPSSYVPIMFWNVNTMFLPICYYVKNVSTKEEITKELNSHHFQIFYDVNDEEDKDNNQLILYVRHNVNDPEANKDRSSVYYTNYYHVDLSRIVGEYSSIKGTAPDKILVKYEENNSNGDYDPSYMTQGVAEINYKYIVDNTQKK